MKATQPIFLVAGLVASIVWAEPAKLPFKPPFAVRDAVIVDQDGKKVKLWGVNYLAPFNHNFVNIQQSGADLKTAIDTDIAHFKLMGIDFIRVHLYDREITDNQGHLIENAHLNAFDYLVEQAYQNGIFMMLTPTVWWNTVENEKRLSEGYAYWDLSQNRDFGFSNYFAKDAILWHPEAIACQQRYLRGLFRHKNAYSPKRLCDYPNIVVIELTNEPKYITEACLDNEPAMGSAVWAKEAPPKILKPMYEAFAENWKAQQKKPDAARQEILPYFKAEILKRYFAVLWPVVDEAFPQGVVKSHIEYEVQNPVIAQALTGSGVQAVNVVAYWNATGKFDGGNTDWNNFLEDASAWLTRHQAQRFDGLAKIIYEFGASSSLDGYVAGAFAAAFRRADVQMAAFFTYTPSAVAAYNPGWLIHYLNLEHTPNKAAAFAAAGEIFRSEIGPDALKRGDDIWTGSTFEIARKPSNVVFYDEADGRVFRYAAATDRAIQNPARLETLSGRGNSRAVACDGSGSYYLRKVGPDQWRLWLFANQKYVNDPAGAKTFRAMANRYMNIDNLPVVSRLIEQPVAFRFKLGKVVRCERVRGEKAPELKPNGDLTLCAGEYLLTVEPGDAYQR
ncbi:MAG TPA: cellulase family glycosylhydrolase [Kiritimatiellia bacterium]|nr:cellulase family glycosylhydrolase [Kiritimatiellia bacterium]HPS09026.1 cellulase family glycosylhydrolase [Kiritimatiellia bacterium]